MFQKLIFCIYDIIITNFSIKVHAFKYKNNIYYIKFLSRLYPFSLFKYLFNFFDIQLIYSVNDMYYITFNKYTILPILLKFNIINDDESIIDFKNKIRNFNGYIPLKFFLDINNLKPKSIDIKYLSNNKIIENQIILNNTKNLVTINEIFYN